MGLWSFYFIAKVALYFNHAIGFHPLPNVALALLALLPTSSRARRIFKQLLMIPLAIALFYYDAFLPPFSRVLAQLPALTTFRADYLLELTLRLVQPWTVVALLALLALHLLLARKLRMSSFAIIALAAACAAPLWQQRGTPAVATAAAQTGTAGATAKDGTAVPGAAELDTTLEAFYAAESARRVSFPGLLPRKTPFDIVYLHVCSLALDDLDYTGQADHPLFKRFNLRFNNFSTGASYSGPAAIRVLRSACGQPRHEDLYKPVDSSCYLFEDFKRAGFEPQWMMNHVGAFGDFAGTVRAQGGLGMPPLRFPAAAVTLRSFDDQPVQDDYEVLSRWWAQRLTQATPQVALYYNSVTLHDGNQITGSGRSNVRESYVRRSKKLLDDFGRFFDLVEASGRQMVVVMVPEHGANVRGDSTQISGLREIPSPAIALAPVGVQLIGLAADTPTPPQRVVSEPTAHLAISQLLAQWMIDSPFDTPRQDFNADVAALPQTPFVAENEGLIVMRHDGRYFLRNPDASWMPYSTQ